MDDAVTMSTTKRLLLLYCSFFRITALVVGGGLAMLPVIEEIFVVKRKLLTREELLDMTALTQTVPGIIAVNSAVYIGMKVAGVPGALAAVAGAFTPPFTVILIIASLFPRLDPHNRYLLGAFAGIRACVTGMILVTGTRMFRRTVKTRLECAVVLIFFVLAILKVSPALLILAAIPFGWCYVWWQTRRLEQAEKSAGPDAESSSNESESASKDAGEGRS
ncbi:MAG: chromate transporter [Lentisphaeria bacterium]|jgi:chromate transporter|nr:chromate transporter [Lentisphaeria bacterium]MDD6337811.1 chromate transporter [Lentisphaeria bacterium]